MQVSKIYNTTKEYASGSSQFDYDNNTDTLINSLFFISFEDFNKGKAATNIFSNNNGGQESNDFGEWFNPNGAKYTNPDGSITKGGLLVAIVNANSYTYEGETTYQGKTEGFDKSMSGAEVKRAWYERNFVLKLVPNDSQNYGIGFGIINPNAQKEWEEQFKNYKDPITQMLEKIRKTTQEELKRLEERKEKQKQEAKKLDIEV